MFIDVADTVLTGPDGNVWAESCDETGLVQANLNTGIASPYEPELSGYFWRFTVGPHKNFRLPEGCGNFGTNGFDLIAQINTSGTKLNKFTVAGLTSPGDITVGPDANLRITNENSANIAKFVYELTDLYYGARAGLKPVSSRRVTGSGFQGNISKMARPVFDGNEFDE